MKIIMLSVLLLILSLLNSTQSYANKLLPVSNPQKAAAIYEAFVLAGAKPIDGIIEIGGTNCITSHYGERDDLHAKWEYITEFTCSLDATPSYDSQKPIDGARAQGIITALNRAGIHSYRTKVASHNYTSTFFIQSLSCEKAMTDQRGEPDTKSEELSMYMCTIEI
jgi:hypothetical protein